jgi:hypothetical protein
MSDHDAKPLHRIREENPPKCCNYVGLRNRAFAKADTGQYADWREVGAAVEADDCPGALKRLEADPILTKMLEARCSQARNKD